MYSFANKWVQCGSVRLHIIHPAKCRPNPESTCWFHPQSFTKKSKKNCIVSLKLSQPSLESSHFQHTENFIQPSSSHHSAILRGRQIAIAQTHLPRGALDDIAQAQAYGVAEPVAQASTKDRHATKQAFLPRKKRWLHLFKPNKNANIPSTSINNCDANV